MSDRVAEEYLLAYRGATERAYRGDMRDLWAHARRVGLAPLELRRAHLDAWARDMQNGRGLSAATIARRLATANGFYRYAVDDELLTRSPMGGVRRPRVPSESPVRGLTPEVMRGLLRSAAAHSSQAAVLLHLMVLYGCRIGEVLAGDVRDLVDEAHGPCLDIRRKGGKRSRLPLFEPTLGHVVAATANRSRGPLLQTTRGSRMSYSTALRLVRTVAVPVLGEAAAARLRPHQTRHAWHSAAIAAGTPLDVLQRAASHASPSTTWRYVHAQEDLAQHPAYDVARWLELAHVRSAGPADAPATSVERAHLVLLDGHETVDNRRPAPR